MSIRRILVANRGEIAVRVIRACRELGIRSIAVYSDCDQDAFHVRLADEAYPIGPAPSNQSYLNQEKIIAVAKQAKADAVHPGYGFLSENESFAKRCQESGLIFIGPKPETIALLGDKLAARKTAIEAGLPVVPGDTVDASDVTRAANQAEKIGYPVLVKAAAGGGGKGMRVVDRAEELPESLRAAANEAKSAFGDPRVYLEKYLTQPRHVEIQILCDAHGNYLYLGERECSIQRRHQKVIEESPSPIMTPELREKMGRAAVALAKKCGYVNAGTVEFLVDEKRNFYFLEVNTRLQVEHPVTEMVTGVDLVHQQIAIAEGRPILFTQDDIKLRGHALECRIYAEDPDNGFMPSTGTLKSYVIPAGPNVRVDSGVVQGSQIPIYYDPMIAKLVVWGGNREEAINRMQRALQEYRVSGVETTIGFHRVVLDHPRFKAGDFSTRFLQEEYPDNLYRRSDPELEEQAALAVALDRFIRERRVATEDVTTAPPPSNWKMQHRLRQMTGLKRA